MLALALALTVVACAPTHARSDGRPLDQFTVARPGLVLFEPAVRAATLDAVDEATRERFCGPEREDWPTHRALTKVKTATGEEGDQTDGGSEPFAWIV